jgi:protein SCO1/2
MIFRVFLSFWLAAASLAAQWPNATPEQLQGVGLEQRLNEQVPLDLAFRDDAGRPVSLRQYFGRKPVVLALVYYECPMLCTLVLNGLLRSLRALSFDAGRDFEVVAVSIDPAEKPSLAAINKRRFTSGYARPGAADGVHFLTGEEAAIQSLAQAVGFRYRYDAKTDQYAHASGIMLLTPDGRLARYFYGVEYSARDLRLGLVEASAGRIGTPVDQILLYCFHYDPATGKYGAVILNILRILGLATVAALSAFLIVMLRRDRRDRRMAASV